jgi:putative transposase
MLNRILIVVRTILLIFAGYEQVALENLALREQLDIFQRSVRHPKIRQTDRLFWVCLQKVWKEWRSALVIVRPETVLDWQRRRFKRYWCQLSQHKNPGRPRIGADIRKLMKTMADANVGWGAPRIHGELLKLGIEVSERTVSRLMPKRNTPPSQTWRAFLDNHIRDLVSIDFFTVPTARLRVLFVFIVLSHERRRVIHFNTTEHPTAAWTAQQIIEAFPEDQAPRYLVRDRDGIYGEYFQNRVAGMGIREVRTAARSPWQNPYAERVIGSIRRECLNHVIVLNDKHLRGILTSYFRYYHESRTHLSLDKDSPTWREIQPNRLERIVQIPQVGGLHHRYERRAA